jgi:MFS family permease
MSSAFANAERDGWLPVVPDTAPRRRLSLRQMVLLSGLWFGISYLWNPLALFILPSLVRDLTHPVPVHLGALTTIVDKNTYLALLEGLGTIFAVVWQPAIGAISDRSRFAVGRRRPFIAVGALGVVLCLSLMAAVPSFWLLFIVYSLLQLSSNTAQGPYQGMLPDQVRDDQRGEASGYYGFLQMIGLIAAAVIIGILVPERLRWLSILSIAAVFAITASMAIFGVRDVRTTRRSTQTLGRSIGTSFVLDVKRYPDFAWLMASRLLFLIALTGIQRFALYFLQYTFHLTADAAKRDTGYLLIIIVAVAASVSLTAGYLSERFGRKRFVAAACVIGAVGAVLMITAQSIAMVLAFGVILGIGLGIFLSVDWAFATDLIPKAEAGRYMGVSNIATASSGIIAGFLLGPIIDIFNKGGTSTIGYRVLFGVSAAFFVIAFFTLRPVREIKVE